MSTDLDFELQWLKRLAAQELSNLADKQRDRYWRQLLVIFEQWKQEHGEREPTLWRRVPRPDAYGIYPPPRIDFHTAKPYQCAGPGVYNNSDLAYRLWLSHYPPLERYIDTLGNKLIGTCKCFAVLALKDETADAPSFLRIVGTMAEMRQDNDKLFIKELAPAAKQRAKVEKNLAKGRPLGTRENAIQARKRRELWQDFALGAFKHHPSWGYKRMVSEIQKRPLGKKRNGKSYSARRIEDVIQGTKQKALQELD